MIVSLQYSLGGSTFNRDFQIISANFIDVEIESVLHKGLGGAFSESPVGYRRKVTIEFVPFGPHKDDVYWLHGFAIGTDREAGFEDTLPNFLSLPGEFMDFNFFEETFFANGLTLTLVERYINTITDTGSTRIFKPSYSASDFDNLTGETLTRYVNFVDECSIGVVKKDFRFLGHNADDVCFAFYHKFTVDFGYVNADRHQWLIEFALWGLKQLDTTLLDADNGKVFDVVFAGKELKFEYENGVHKATTLKMIFYERVPRTTPEAYVPPPGPPTFILDESKLDEAVLG